MGMDVYGKSGNYFRASCWSWRPIHALAEELNMEHNLMLDLTGWGFNDGNGLHSQADCDKLATAIEKHVSQGRKEYELTFPGAPLVGNEGVFLREGETGGRTAYRADAEHVLEFAKFLRECGGSFEIL